MEALDKSLTRMRFSSHAAGLNQAKRIGVALGPGLPFGLVDLGMLIALKQLKIPVSMISGTSMGAVMGALYAAGRSPEEIRDGVIEFFGNNVLRNILKSGKKAQPGFTAEEKLLEALAKFAGWDPEFYELAVPLFVVAADKVSQTSVILRHGRVLDAVHASMAMPLVLEEKQLGGMQLADGAIFAPLDTKVLYNEGADFVIAIHAKLISSERRRDLPLRKKLEPLLLKTLGWKVDTEMFFSKPACDILLRPRVPLALATDGKRVNEIIELGIKITYDAMHEIEKGEAPKRAAAPAKESQQESVAKINLEMEAKANALENYLREIEPRLAKMSDAELMDEFPKFARLLQAFLDDISNQHPDLPAAREALKDKLKHLVHVVDESPFMSRCLRKPLGYAGDYQMMNYIYDNEVFAASTNMGKLLNYFLFSLPSVNAVRNRAKIIRGIVQATFLEKNRLAVASIACGPAREVAATLEPLTDRAEEAKITWTLLDQDKEALDSARRNLPKNILLEPNLINAGVRNLLKSEVRLGPQDIIYSLGLFDYLEDKVAISLIRILYGELNPGGLMMIGNFDQNNPVRAFMEGVLEWYLIHRTEAEMLALAKAGAPEGRHFVIAEPSGVNLLLVTTKPLQE